jgi:xanthine dehydrogenase small subunit
VQQALVDCHGSQCGFCTPGFVMSLWSTYEHHQDAGTQPTRQQLADDLSGNLCRCTGYRPILDAGQRMFDLPAVRLDTEPVVAALQSLKHEPSFDYAAPLGQRIDHFHAPTTLAQLAALREAKPAAQLLSGSTDVGLWVNKQFRDLGDIIYVGDVTEMKVVQERAKAGPASSTSAPAPPSRTLSARSLHACPASPTCGCASPRRPSAMPAPWAAMWPTARPSATRRRC